MRRIPVQSPSRRWIIIRTEPGSAFPYVGGARYRADMTRPQGERIVSVEIKNEKGKWKPLNDTTAYLIVTNSYLANGGDGYHVLRKTSRYRYDTGFVDTEVFMEYASKLGTLHPPKDTGVTYIK
ncbi:MAG: 5'-nucleotidase C-terminal domain-containing protein [Deltaproteobacteria bacterium]|nr:5'-nucleotidase C-terminal domain-containing protein [Deltaproteobacteria bacterium]